MSASNWMPSAVLFRFSSSSPLVDAQPTEQREHDAVGVAGEIGEDDLQVEAVLERERMRRGAADLAVVDEDQQPIRAVLEFGHGSEQVSAQAFGFVHGCVC